jgi:hypothetical protein
MFGFLHCFIGWLERETGYGPAYRSAGVLWIMSGALFLESSVSVQCCQHLVKGGTSQLVSEPYEYNMTLTVIFLKTYGEDTCRCPYKDYSSLDRWQAHRDLLSVFNFCNLPFATMHLCHSKKVSILVPSDVNSGPIASRRGLLEAVPIMR